MMKINGLLILSLSLTLSLAAKANETLSCDGTTFGLNAVQIVELDGGDTDLEQQKQAEIEGEATESQNEPLSQETGSVWIEFSTKPNGDVFFFDNTRVEKNGSQISVWVRIRYKTSIMAASSYQNHTELDCSEHSETILQDTFYTDKDWTKPAMATNTNAKPKKTVQKNSASEQLISILCKD